MGAYNKILLDEVKNNFGAMLDCGINALGFESKAFYNMFLTSKMSKRINSGDCYIISTLGGVELAELIVNHAMNNSRYVHVKRASDSEFNTRLNNAIVHKESKEYWAGSVIAEYAWEKNMSYQELNRYIGIEEVVSLYDSFGDVDYLMVSIRIDEMIKGKKTISNLKVRREKVGLSQRDLANATGIPVRTIQQYEQRQKRINKASAEYLVKMSTVLKCDVRDIME